MDQEAPEGYVYVAVETGISDDSYTEILSGLQEGDTVAYLQTASGSDGMDFMGWHGHDALRRHGGMPPAAGCPAADPEEASDGRFD